MDLTVFQMNLSLRMSSSDNSFFPTTTKENKSTLTSLQIFFGKNKSKYSRKFFLLNTTSLIRQITHKQKNKH